MSDRASPYNEFKKTRLSVGNFTGWSTGTATRKCPFCQQKMDVVTENGRKIGRCRRGCKELVIEETKTGTKFTPKYGSTNQSHSFLISQPKRKRKGVLDFDEEEEARALAAAFGGSGSEDARLEASDTKFYENGNWS